MDEKQEHIGCSIVKETDTTFEINITQANGGTCALVVAKSEVRPIKLPFQSDIFPGNTGLAVCTVLEKKDTTVVVSIKGEPAEAASHIEVPLEALATRRD